MDTPSSNEVGLGMLGTLSQDNHLTWVGAHDQQLCYRLTGFFTKRTKGYSSIAFLVQSTIFAPYDSLLLCRLAIGHLVGLKKTGSTLVWVTTSSPDQSRLRALAAQRPAHCRLLE